MTYRPTLVSCISLVAGLMVFGSVEAADTSTEANTESGAAGTLEEVVVTAQKRSESVQDVPVSVTVISNEELSRQGVQTIADLSRMSSSIEFTAASAAPGGGAFIRGIGTESVGGDTATASVSVVLDGVVLGNTNITDIFDIQRVEVLKGPQGTLFGSSVSAGVISITTAAPNPSKMSADLSAEYGSGDLGSQYSRRSVRGVANLPISADSALRLSFHADDNEDLVHNVHTGVDSDAPDIGARLRYLWNVNDDLQINLIGDYNKARSNGVPVLLYRSAPAGSALGGGGVACGVTPSTTNTETCAENGMSVAQTDRGVSAQVDWSLSGLTLTSISSYRIGDTSNLNDIEAIPLSITSANFALGTHCFFVNCVPIFAIVNGAPNAPQIQHRNLISEELRVASPKSNHLEWVAGLYYQHYKLKDDEPGSLTANFGGGQFTEDTHFYANVHTEDYAAFGNATYHITDALRVIAGARYTHSNVAESKFDPANSGTNITYSLSTSASKPSYRAGLQADLSHDTMVYATVSTGYKAPEISDLLTNGGHLYAVSPELPTSYEIGIKQSVLDNRLAIDADVFYERVKDYQGQNCIANNQGTISCAPTNVPIVNSKGIELDIFGRPFTGTSVNVSGIYNPASYPAGYLGSDGSNLGGQQLNYASKQKVTVSAEQLLPVGPNYDIVIDADAAYRSRQSMYLAADPHFTAPAGTIFNARLGLRSAQNWSIYVFARNIGAVAFPRQLYPTPFQPGGYWQVLDANSRRLVGFQMEAQF
jgi:iron complex outermembrane recepter protein